jgi:putative phosphoesterase
MLLGVISDTHGNLRSTRQAMELLAPRCPEVLLHCGDVGSLSILALFSEFPTHFVLGNVDRDVEEISAAIRQRDRRATGGLAA